MFLLYCIASSSPSILVVKVSKMNRFCKDINWLKKFEAPVRRRHWW
jgi:hypothetical protein